MPWISGLKPKANVGEGIKPRLIALIKGEGIAAQSDRYKHGEKRTWQLALDAVSKGAATSQDVLSAILMMQPDYNRNNLGYDLAMLSVNAPARTSYSQNAKPRRTDQGSEFDRLFKIGDGQGVSYELYDPAQHGVWEIYADPSAANHYGMAVRQVVSPVVAALTSARVEAEQAGAFDVENVDDARKRVLAEIVRRQGQPAFRKSLFDTYGGACAITGCTLSAILEAAHVHPYMGEHTNVVSNGLLLRTDIHTLFDLRLIAIDPDSLTVLVSPELDGTDYDVLRGRRMREAKCTSQHVSVEALMWHRARCEW